MLDFSQVTTQIQRFAGERERAQSLLAEALGEAGQRLRNAGPEWETVQDKIDMSRTSWLLADWTEPPDAIMDAPPRPLPHTILAADGSQIVADRHDIALCYLLNVGHIALHYGTDTRPTLTSRPTLHFPDDDLLAVSEGDQSVIAPRRLAVRRLLAEFAGLLDLCGEEPGVRGQGPEKLATNTEHQTLNTEQYRTPNTGQSRRIAPTPSTLHRIPSLALSDGTLILWPLETETDEFRERSLTEFQGCLESFRIRRVPIVGYISAPQSRDVVNALRIAVCPHQTAHCEKRCPNQHKSKPHYVAPPCAYVERITDRELFETLLLPGQRSAVFASRSQIITKFYKPQHQIRFFYFNTGREIARVEFPAWVSDDAELLARTHALCYDQCVKGDGYPVALAEAHEQAIVRGPERQAFFMLMEREFVRTRQTVPVTQKAISKRARRV